MTDPGYLKKISVVVIIVICIIVVVFIDADVTVAIVEVLETKENGIQAFILHFKS